MSSHHQALSLLPSPKPQHYLHPLPTFRFVVAHASTIRSALSQQPCTAEGRLTPVHRQRAPSRDVTSQTPDLSCSPPNVHVQPSARKKRKAPQLPPQPIRGLGHFGWKRPCIPPHSSGLSPSPPSLTSPESSPFRPPDHRKRTPELIIIIPSVQN